MIQRIRWLAVAYSAIACRTLCTAFVVAVVGIVLGNEPLARLGAFGALWAILAMIAAIPLTQLPRR